MTVSAKKSVSNASNDLTLIVIGSSDTQASMSSSNDLVGDLKLLISAKTGTDKSKIILKKWHNVFKDHISLADCISFPLLLFET